MIYRGLSCTLILSDDQASLLDQASGVNRLVYNLALEQRRDWWRHFQRNTGNNLNWITQCKQLTALRKEFDFIRLWSAASQQAEIKNLDDAFRKMWKAGAGFPSFRKRGLGDRIICQGRDISIERLNAKFSRVRIPKIVWLKFRQTRQFQGKIFEATIARGVKGWSISFGQKIDRELDDVGGVVALDRGVAIPVMCSDGVFYSLPDGIAKAGTSLNRAQRIASRRKRGSKRHAKAMDRIRKLYARKARIRKDWAHRLTTDISRKYGTVIVERLRTKNMTKRAHDKGVAQKRGLNRSILNVGWAQIGDMLAYKVYRYIKVDPAYSSQTCSSCGTVDSKSRKSQASFVCTSCGHRDNADRNAAAVILQRGNTALLDVEGCGCAPVEASTALMATAA